MQSYQIYDWMVGGGLELKGLQLSLYALIASYSRKGKKMYISRSSLSEFLMYSERQVGSSLQILVDEGLVVREIGANFRAYTIQESVARARIKNKDLVNSFEHYLRHSERSGQEKTSSSWGEEISSQDRKKVLGQQEEISCLDGKKLPVKQEKNSPHNINNIQINNSTYKNVVAAPSDAELIEMVLFVFFFKNNCNPRKEANTFIQYYKSRQWKLSGGKIIDSEQELILTAESWDVKNPIDTGRRDNFMKGWREVYKIVPAHLKNDAISIKTPVKSPTSSDVCCSATLAEWLEANRPTVEAIFRALVCGNYKIQWYVRPA